MDMVDKYFVNIAHNQTKESHHTNDETSDIFYNEDQTEATFSTIFKLEFPSSILGDETPLGVKRFEEVRFIFDKGFPYKAPIIFLRDDFPKVFPHINPTKEKVNPCIYEGSNDELLQQPNFFFELLDQIASWLDKAVTNDLIDLEQGWEPMRTDFNNGIISFPVTFIEEAIRSGRTINSIGINYSFLKNDFIQARIEALDISKFDKINHSFLIPLVLTEASSNFFPNDIFTYNDFIKFTKKISLKNVYDIIGEYAKHLKKISLLFITILIKRPVHLIGTDSDIEILNFAIEVKYDKIKRNIKANSKSYTLASIEPPSKELLTKFSGINKKNNINKNMKLIQLGCGSLGSKIITHIARTGLTDDITLIDNDLFNAHNHARHTLTGISNGLKSELLYEALLEMGLSRVNSIGEDIKECLNIIKDDSILIDATADFSIRNFLIKKEIKSEVIHVVLHNLSTYGLVLIESKNRAVRLDDLLSYFYLLCYREKKFFNIIKTDKTEYQMVGQGCGSLTTITTDAEISYFSAPMSMQIQNELENGLSEDTGKLNIGNLNSNLNLEWDKFKIKAPLILFDKSFGYEVRINSDVVEKILKNSTQYSPNETGGVLIGNISLVNKVISIVDLIDPPEDSKRTKVYFELGTTGLQEKVLDYEKKTNGLLTYIGTWHSHPMGGSASVKDLKTKTELIRDRKGFPTVCLINSKGNIIIVENGDKV
ncbi:Mov34/MPN/PAD-1 family protein [Arcobacter aquimarinus]